MVTCDIRGHSGPEREKHGACFKPGGGEHLSEEGVYFQLSLAGKGGHPGKELEVEHSAGRRAGEDRGLGGRREDSVPGVGAEKWGHGLGGPCQVGSGPAVCVPLSCGIPEKGAGARSSQAGIFQNYPGCFVESKLETGRSKSWVSGCHLLPWVKLRNEQVFGVEGKVRVPFCTC